MRPSSQPNSVPDVAPKPPENPSIIDSGTNASRRDGRAMRWFTAIMLATAVPILLVEPNAENASFALFALTTFLAFRKGKEPTADSTEPQNSDPSPPAGPASTGYRVVSSQNARPDTTITPGNWLFIMGFGLGIPALLDPINWFGYGVNAFLMTLFAILILFFAKAFRGAD